MGARGLWLGAVLVWMAAVAAGCNASPRPEPPPGGKQTPTEVPPGASTDAGASTPDAGTFTDAGGADAGGGVPDAGTGVDAGTPTDAGTLTDGGTPEDGGSAPDAGPWPTDALLDYSQTYGLGTPQSVGLDEGLNLWLLDNDRIGVLRPGDAAPTWVRGIGQASQPFGPDALAVGSTVICGGAAGRAYVGYRAREMQPAEGISQRTYIPWPGEPNYSPERFAEYKKGDLDVVKLEPDGGIALEEHLWRTTGLNNKGRQAGLHNTNDFHFDEDRSVFKCARVTRGPHRGDVYVTTNHGVTMIQGLTYNSHRHPGWYLYIDGSPWGTLQCPYMHALGIAPNGDVLVANDQMAGVLVPDGVLEHWDRENTFEGPVPWRFKGYDAALNPQDVDDLWRGFEQTTSGTYYLASAAYGLWSMTIKSHTSADWTRVPGLPTNAVPALKATDDGALYVGTDGAGLWRLEPDGVTLTRVEGIAGDHVRELLYEPTVTPSMLLVLTDRGLTVLRGP